METCSDQRLESGESLPDLHTDITEDQHLNIIHGLTEYGKPQLI